MIKSREVVRRITQLVIEKNISRSAAATLLETSVRSIYNYEKRYKALGALGLIDRRHGNHHKLSAETERQIIQCKLQRPQRSAHWIRNWLKLDVSSESVRRVLVKHQLNPRAAPGGPGIAVKHRQAKVQERKELTW